MKKIFMVMSMAFLLCHGVYIHGQNTPFDEFSFDDSTFVYSADDTEAVDSDLMTSVNALIPTLSREEKEKVQNLLATESLSVIYDDSCGHVIYRQINGKYGFINIRMFNQQVLENQDTILTISIGENEEGLLAKVGDKMSVYTYEGLLMIPQVTADSVVKVVKNVYKSGQGRLFGYAIVTNNNKLYAADTYGRYYRLTMDKALMENNLIFGLKGNEVMVYTTDGSETEEAIFEITDEEAEYEEVEVLSTIGHARYNYLDKKYNDISPGVVVKKHNHYWLYPGGEKLHVKSLAKDNILEGYGNNKKVIFSKHLYSANELKQKLNSAVN